MTTTDDSEAALAGAQAELARLAPDWLQIKVSLEGGPGSDHTSLCFTWGGEEGGMWSHGLDDSAHDWLPLTEQALQATHEVLRRALNGYIPLEVLVGLMAEGPNLSPGP